VTTHFSSLKPHKQASVSGPGSGAFAFRVEAQRHPSNLHDRPPRAPPRLSSPGPCLFPSGRAPFCPPFSLSLSLSLLHATLQTPARGSRTEQSRRAEQQPLRAPAPADMAATSHCGNIQDQDEEASAPGAADLYAVLGLNRECTDAELRVAYRRLAMVRFSPSSFNLINAARLLFFQSTATTRGSFAEFIHLFFT